MHAQPTLVCEVANSINVHWQSVSRTYLVEHRHSESVMMMMTEQGSQVSIKCTSVALECAGNHNKLWALLLHVGFSIRSSIWY